MNVLILSAILGVLMMFAGLSTSIKPMVKNLAIGGAVLLLVADIMEMKGLRFFDIPIKGMLVFDGFGLLFIAVLLFCIIIYFILSGSDIIKVGSSHAEYFSLLFFIICGMVLTVGFASLLMLFLGIEIISIPLYILTGSDKRNLKSNEASLKYFLMGSFSTGILLMGIALLYGASGTFTLSQMNFIADGKTVLPIAGMLFILCALAFKVSAAPFHFWTPDVYDGAPTVFTSFMATVVKAAFFAGFLRLFHHAFGGLQPVWQIWVASIVAITLFIGNITAVYQQSVKRMLAYSSIAQAGFMLMSVFSANSVGTEGLLLYAASYSLATIGIFAVLSRMADYTYEGFNGFAKQQPVVAFALSIFLLSLVGIPLTAGFLAKFYMLNASVSVGAGFYWLLVVALLMAAISAYYYFKIIQAMYFKEGGADIVASRPFKASLVVVAVLIVALGLAPNLVLYWLYF